MRSGLLIATLALSLATPARAQQCGSAVSECLTCHELRGARPVVAGPLPWHVDHAFADLCAQCHGGNPRAADEAAAHAGVSSPLADPGARCGGCHGRDAARLAQRYLGLATRASATARPPTPQPTRVRKGNVVLTALIALVGASGVAYAARNERRSKGASS